MVRLPTDKHCQEFNQQTPSYWHLFHVLST